MLSHTYVHYPPNLGYTNSPADGQYTLQLSDADELVRFEASGAGCSVIVPSNASVAFEIGTKVWIEIANAGTVQIRGASGVTLSRQVTLTSRSQQVCLTKTAANNWNVGGLGI